MKKFPGPKEIINNFLYDLMSFTSGRVSITIEGLVIFVNYKLFNDVYNFLKKSQWWTEGEIKAYQLKELKKIVNQAYKYVPYYKQLFDENSLKPEDIKTLDDLKKIPFLIKKIVQEKTEELKALNYPKHKFAYVTTSGSTAIPLGLYNEKGISHVIDMAYSRAFLDRIGRNPQDKTVILRGDVLPKADKGKFWRYSLFRRFLVLSSYHITDENLPRYIDKIRRLKPTIFSAYPSSITILASFMKKNNIPPFETLKVIICGAETLYDWQRELIENVFGVRVFENYGHAEQAVNAASCEKSNYFHFFPEYGIVELIDKNGKLVTKEGEIGEIVATGFKNHIFPFIRYKTGDLGVYTEEKCSCGRNYPLVKKIYGRIQEFIITSTDRLISMTAFNMHSDVFDNVSQFQFYQDKKGEVVFKLIKRGSYSGKDTEKIRRTIGHIFGDDVNLIIEFVDKISRTPRGKHRYLVQKLQMPIDFNR